MSPVARIVIELVSIAVALWFLLSPSFDDLPAKRALDAVAIFVIGLALWRLFQLWRTR
ncbi:hypothetical protein [Jannaschia seohaensis]|uniref:Uncharacterized protein n=1 Tax=Jannaschia seohaensis TaxID=475081 RepID=A0A2Y9ABV4_9RHOB|nr:hypothetical protein [Jannaschia seohaensis]PWJ21265.1 hypothetical protein BCF38_102515 [Jannaschia seohaensis]SSA41675.1 hypothetical protein SAMN05421539_102515 [Jannaschia seohaensis]